MGDDAADGAELPRGRIGGEYHPDLLARRFLEVAVIEPWLGDGVVAADLDHAVHVFREGDDDGIGQRAARHVSAGGAAGDGDILPMGTRFMNEAHQGREVGRVFRRDDEGGAALEDAGIAREMLKILGRVADVAVHERNDFVSQRHPRKYNSSGRRMGGHMYPQRGFKFDFFRSSSNSPRNASRHSFRSPRASRTSSSTSSASATRTLDENDSPRSRKPYRAIFIISEMSAAGPSPPAF